MRRTIFASPKSTDWTNWSAGELRTSWSFRPFFQGKAEFTDLYPEAKKWCNAPSKIAEPADVLISVRAPVGPSNLCREKSGIGRGLAALRPKDGVSSKYLLYAVRASANELKNRSTGTTFEAISGSTLRGHLITLAPVEARGGVVSAIEQQLTRLDDTVTTLRRAATRVRVLRSALLGRAWHGAQTQASLGELSVASDYGTSQKASYDADGPPILRIPNVAHGRLDLRDLKHATKPTELKDARALRPGDFLIIRTNGSRDLIGRGGVVETQFSAPHFHASYLIRFRLSGNAPLWRWISLIWSAPALRTQMNGLPAVPREHAADAVDGRGVEVPSQVQAPLVGEDVRALLGGHRSVESLDLRHELGKPLRGDTELLQQIGTELPVRRHRSGLLRRRLVARRGLLRGGLLRVIEDHAHLVPG